MTNLTTSSFLTPQTPFILPFQQSMTIPSPTGLGLDTLYSFDQQNAFTTPESSVVPTIEVVKENNQLLGIITLPNGRKFQVVVKNGDSTLDEARMTRVTELAMQILEHKKLIEHPHLGSFQTAKIDIDEASATFEKDTLNIPHSIVKTAKNDGYDIEGRYDTTQLAKELFDLARVKVEVKSVQERAIESSTNLYNSIPSLSAVKDYLYDKASTAGENVISSIFNRLSGAYLGPVGSDEAD